MCSAASPPANGRNMNGIILNIYPFTTNACVSEENLSNDPQTTTFGNASLRSRLGSSKWKVKNSVTKKEDAELIWRQDPNADLADGKRRKG
jgi:hypothetical protein